MRRARPGSGVGTVSVKHQPPDCRRQDATCYKCQQRGHIVPACKTSVPYKEKKGKTHVLEDEVQDSP